MDSDKDSTEGHKKHIDLQTDAVGAKEIRWSHE